MKQKKYSQLKKEIRNLSIAQGAMFVAGGALLISAYLYMKQQGIENFSSVEQFLATLPAALVPVVSVELIDKIKDKIENKQENLFYDFENSKEDYLKAFYKKLGNKQLSKEEENVLFGYPEFNHVRLVKNVEWFSSYELALRKGQTIGLSPVSKNPDKKINEDSFIFSKNKQYMDGKIKSNIEEIKCSISVGVPYVEFQIIVPRNDLSGKKEKTLTFGFTDMEQVYEFEKQMNAVKAKMLKFMERKRIKKALDKEALEQKF